MKSGPYQLGTSSCGECQNSEQEQGHDRLTEGMPCTGTLPLVKHRAVGPAEKNPVTDSDACCRCKKGSWTDMLLMTCVVGAGLIDSLSQASTMDSGGSGWTPTPSGKPPLAQGDRRSSRHQWQLIQQQACWQPPDLAGQGIPHCCDYRLSLTEQSAQD